MRVIAPVVLLASICASQLCAQTTGSVEGEVVDRVTGSGIADATVAFYIRTQQGAIYESKTDASGEFRIFGMKPGSYEVRFEKDGYRFGNKIPPQPYIVGETPSPVRVRLEMTRMVTLSGRVVDPDGNAMTQGSVKVVNRNAVPVEADGTFTIKELDPGSYTLTAVPKSTRVPEGSRAPVPTHSPGPILIRGDADISGYEIRLETAEVYRVSGVVVDEAGNPKPKVLVQLLPKIQSEARALGGGNFMTFVGPGPSVGPEEAQVISGEDGSFEFDAVRSGEWQVATGLSGQVQIDSFTFINTFHSGVASVIIGNHSVEDIQLRQTPTFKVSATVDWGDAPSNRRASVGLRAVDGRSVFTTPAEVDQKGTINFPSVRAGQYLILPQAGPGFYPVSVVLNGQEVLGKPVELFPGSSFRVAYKAAHGSVRESVDNCNGALVALIPRDVQSMGFGRMDTCKPDGTVDMPGVPPGDYFAVAFDPPQRTLPTPDAAWLARVESTGTSVSVGQTAVSVQLKLNPSPD